MVEKEVKMQFFTASIVMKGESYCCQHIVAFVGAFAPFVLPFVCADVTKPSLPSGNEDRRGGVQNNTKRPSSEKPRTRVYCYSVKNICFCST